MKPPLWSKKQLYQHLQHAIDVEFWTIPLYLTSLYSIKSLKDLQPKDYPDAAKLIQSVVIQEMLHMELVCNISNALGYAPEFNIPQYDNITHIPFIHPSENSLPEFLHGYECKPGALGPATLKLFCAIELPQDKSSFNPGKQSEYHSIPEMYASLSLGIKHLWEECYVGDKLNTKQKAVFTEYQRPSGRHHGFSVIVNSLDAAMKAIEAIIEQGEGASRDRVPVDFRPPKPGEGKEFDPEWFKGELSHYHKFCTLLHYHKHLPEVYTDVAGDAAQEQEQLDMAFYRFMNELTASFSSEGPDMTPAFWNNMFGLSKAIMNVWEKGACPRFNKMSALHES